MANLACIDDYRLAAESLLAGPAWGYYSSGAGDHYTLGDNVDDFRRWLIVPRHLRDVSQRRTDVALLRGAVPLCTPIVIAPTAFQRLAHPDGELATARAAAKLGTAMTLSTLSTSSLEDVAAAAGPDGQLLMQIYVERDRRATSALVRRVCKAGYKALVVTVDAPVPGVRRQEIRQSFKLPPHLSLPNVSRPASAVRAGFSQVMAELMDDSLTWADIDWLVNESPLPVLVKGVLSAGDAQLSMEHGAAGVVVSNHGGRQLDSAPSGVAALCEVTAVLRSLGRPHTLLVDGGVRSGTDVFKALALGAHAVCIGRPVIWALAVDGEAGVTRALRMLHNEFRTTMALAGCRSVSEITGSSLRRKEQYFAAKL